MPLSLSLAVVLVLWIRHRRRPRTRLLETRRLTGLPALPLLVWGWVATRAQWESFNWHHHGNELVHWIPVMEAFIALLAILTFQTLGLLPLWPRQLEVGAGGRFRPAVICAMVTVALDALFILYLLRL